MSSVIGRVVAMVGVGAVALLAALPAQASVPADTALRTRIGDHAPFVRVVVDVAGRALAPGPIQATDPDPYADGRITIRVPDATVRSGAGAARGTGVRVALRVGSGGLVITVDATRRRFKYAGYQVLHAPERLVIDLYKSRPPRAGATARYGRPGCLTIDAVTSVAGLVRASGTERDVFEHSFPLRVRAAAGRLAGTHAASAAAGRWRASVRHAVAHAQTGTLEAVDLSAKDGALVCLAQRPVALRP